MPKAWQLLARGRDKMSFAILAATPDCGRMIFIGRVMSATNRSRVAEAEMTAACFVLGDVPMGFSVNNSNDE